MDRELDVLQNYKAVSIKVKRRFLKKPNFAEASEQFGTLTNVLERQECSSYAGFCCLAKARCENTLGNSAGETEALLKSARLFASAELNDLELKCPTFEENLSEAIHCFNQAVKAYKKHGYHPLAALTSLEIALVLQQCGKLDESFEHFMRAAEIQRTFSITDSLYSLLNAVSCKITSHNLSTALKVASEVREHLQYIRSYDKDCCTITINDMMGYCEVTIVLLILNLDEGSISNLPELKKQLVLYRTVDWEGPSYINEETLTLIQSLVMAFDIKDIASIKLIENELMQNFNEDQKILFNYLMEGLKET